MLLKIRLKLEWLLLLHPQLHSAATQPSGPRLMLARVLPSGASALALITPHPPLRVPREPGFGSLMQTQPTRLLSSESRRITFLNSLSTSTTSNTALTTSPTCTQTDDTTRKACADADTAKCKFGNSAQRWNVWGVGTWTHGGASATLLGASAVMAALVSFF